MTTVPMSTAPDMTSDATFRTWGLAISNAMVSIGWVKVTDAAQINWATVTKPGTANTAAGYEIWGMADTLQATKPVYLKLEYGSGSTTSTPSTWLTVGTGQNGSGTLTGQVGTRQQAPIANNTNAQTCYFSGSPSRLTAYLWDIAAQLTLWLVERTHDGTGADTDAGVLWAWGAQSYTYCQYIPFTGTIPAVYQKWNCTSPPTGNGTYTTTVFMYPVRAWGPGETCPFLGVAAYFNGDIGTGQITATDWSGASRNFYAAAKGVNPSYGGTTVWAVLYV